MPPKKTTSQSAPRQRKSNTKSSKASVVQDSFAEIRARAFEIFMERMNSNRPGDAMSDWLKAEEDIRSRHRM